MEDRHCPGNREHGPTSLKSRITETLIDNRVEQAADDAVRFDSSIDARSARMECGF